MNATTTLKTLTVTAVAAAASLFGATAHAATYTEEIRILGPAFSHHLTDHGALEQERAARWDCTATSTQRNAGAFTGGSFVPVTTQLSTFQVDAPMVGGSYTQPTEQIVNALGATPSGFSGGGKRYEVVGVAGTTPSGIQTFNEVICVEGKPTYVKQWHQNNPAIGLEKSWRYDGHVDKVFGTFVRDSYGSKSLMVGVGRLWELGSVGTFNFDGGVVAGAWYRTVLDPDNAQLQRRLIPYLLPALSITETSTGLGANLALAPRMKIPGTNYYASSDTTVMVQLTWLLSKDVKSVEGSRFGFELKKDRGFAASFTMPF